MGKNRTYRIYGEDSVGGDIAKRVGANLVAKSNGKMGNEELIKINLDVIFTVYYGKEIDKEAALYCDEIYAIKAGKIVSYGTPTEVLTKELIKSLYEVDAKVTEDKETGLLNIMYKPSYIK